MTRRPAPLYGAAVALLVVGALAAVWLLTRGTAGALRDLDPAPVPVAAPVTSATLDHAADASLSATTGEGPAVLATALSGTVTRIATSVGATAEPGGVLYAVDGVPVVAYDGDTVLYRSLRTGDRGDDVRRAQELLAALTAREIPADGIFGRATDAAVRAYERQIGRTEPTGVLDAAWFTHLPTSPFVVGSVELQAGQPAPTAGTPVLAGTQTVTQVVVTTDAAGPAGAYEFVAPGQRVPLERDDAGGWAVGDPAAAARAVLSGDVADGTATLSGRVRMVDGLPGQAVPGAAVVTDGSGRTCVVEASTRTPLPVEVEGSGLDGVARVAPTLPEGTTVLVNPLVVLDDVTCPSS